NTPAHGRAEYCTGADTKERGCGRSYLGAIDSLKGSDWGVRVGMRSTSLLVRKYIKRSVGNVILSHSSSSIRHAGDFWCAGGPGLASDRPRQPRSIPGLLGRRDFQARKWRCLDALWLALLLPRTSRSDC